MTPVLMRLKYMWASAAHLTSVLLLSVAWVCPSVAVAQPADSTTLSPETRQIPEVEVRERRVRQDVTASHPVQVADRDKMLSAGLHTVSEALHRMAGLTVRDYGGAGGMKTVSVRGMGSRHTAVIYDGISLNDCQTGETDLSRYSLDYARSVTLQTGDDDNIFQPARHAAAAATLSVRTLGTVTPADGHDARLWLQGGLTFGSWQTVNPSLRVSGSLSPRFRYALTGEYMYAENDYPFLLYNVSLVTKERRRNSRLCAGHAEGDFLWTPDSVSRLSGKLYYYGCHRRLPGAVQYYTQENDERLLDNNTFAQMQYGRRLSARWQLLLSAKYNHVKTDYRNHTAGSVTPDACYRQQEVYASMAWQYAPADWLRLDYSLDYAFDVLTSTLSSYERPVRHSVLQQLAAQGRWRRLKATFRLLHGWYDNQVKSGPCGDDERRLTPSLSFSYRLLTDGNLYARLMYKGMFRMPTFQELYYYHIGSELLRPEKTAQWNAGLSWQNRHNTLWTVSVSADGYLNRVTDKIVSVPFNLFVWRTMNLGKVRILGLDVTVDAARRMGKRHTLQWSGHYSVQRTRNRTSRSSAYYGNQIAYVPLHSYSASVSWMNPWANVSLSSYGQSGRWTTNEHAAGTRLSGFAEESLTLWRTFPIGRLYRKNGRPDRLTVQLSVLNLLDKQYSLVARYPMPGRSWRVSFYLNR